jgi:hypothetical protein
MKVNDISLATCALIVEFNASVWTARKLDREVTRETNEAKSAAADASRTNKNLMAGRSELETITKHVTKVRNFVTDNTSPWSNNGQRLLPNIKFIDFDKKMNTYKEEFDDLVKVFINIYPTLITAQAMALGQMFNRADYPLVSDIVHRFAFTYDYFPVPESGDFRIDIGNDAAADIKQRLEKVATARVDAMLVDLKTRLKEHLERMADRLVTDTDPKTGAPKRRKFHDTLVSSAYDLCDLVKGLNADHDPELLHTVKTLEAALSGTSAEGLRVDSIKRADVKKEVDALLGKFTW